MREKFIKYLNRPFPLFLAHRKGRIYFIWMIGILASLANVFQPFGLINNHEFHKPLLLANYILVFYGIYALLYIILSYLCPRHYHPDTWTIKKEFRTLLYYIPTTAGITCMFVTFTVPDFKLSLPSFVQLQFYNGLLSIISIPTFGYFIDTKLRPTKFTSATKLNIPNNIQPNTATPPLSKGTENSDEEQARKVLQRLHEVMTTEQLYLSTKCNLQLVSEHTGIPVHRISNTINHFSECTFTDFVNKYRVEHVCRILQQGKNKRLKLEAIGLECGFGSKVNFYTTFKKCMGKTPAEYLAGL